MDNGGELEYKTPEKDQIQLEKEKYIDGKSMDEILAPFFEQLKKMYMLPEGYNPLNELETVEVDQWEIDLRAKLDKEIKDGAYTIGEGKFTFMTGKGGYINYLVAVEKELRSWGLEKHKTNDN